VTDPTLPPGLSAECAAADRKLIEDLALQLDRAAMLAGRGDARAAVTLLNDLISGRFRQIAITSYQAGLAQAGQAAQAVEDLAALRRAFRILRER